MSYHSSLQINGTEYCFDMGGIETSKSLRSHDARDGAPRMNTQVIPMGKSNRTGYMLTQDIGHLFERNTYDLVKKNCNSFADAGLYYLLGKRMPKS